MIDLRRQMATRQRGRLPLQGSRMLAIRQHCAWIAALQSGGAPRVFAPVADDATVGGHGGRAP